MSFMKYSALRDSHTKPIDSVDSEGQNEKATRNVLLMLSTLITTNKGSFKTFVLKVPSIIIS
jgi:hypothetical protein